MPSEPNVVTVRPSIWNSTARIVENWVRVKTTCPSRYFAEAVPPPDSNSLDMSTVATPFLIEIPSSFDPAGTAVESWP